MNLKKLKRFTFATLLLGAVLCSGNLLAQDLVSGRVVDADGGAVIGATVMVDGTSTVTITGANGSFSLRAAAGASLTVTYVGYENASATLSPGVVITMNPDSTMIEQLVVVGYGTQKRQTLTGSIAVADEKMLIDKGSISNPLQALQGQVPGVFITRSSSAPGDEGWDMSLRGRVSVKDFDPLIIIDGIAGGSPDDLRLLNPTDIESMSFLKDGAAAIYGSRAAGGVLLITTKKGKEGRARVEYSGSVSVKTPGLLPTMMSYDQFADASMRALENDNNTGNVWYPYYQGMKTYKGTYIDLSKTSNPFAIFGDVADIVFDDKVDWLGSLFDNAFTTSHDLSVSGGTDKASYRISAGYLFDDSPLQYGKNNNNRYNLRLNTSFQIAKWLTLESVIAYSRQEQVKPSNLAGLMDNLPQPGLPLFTMKGQAYAWGTGEANMSPASKAEFGGENELSVSSLNISETFKARINSWLDANVSLGYNTKTSRRDMVSNSIMWYTYNGERHWNTLPTQANTSYTQSSRQDDFYSAAAYLAAHHTFGKSHNVSATLGYQYELTQALSMAVQAKDIMEGLDNINGADPIKNLVNETARGRDARTLKNHSAVGSMFGRINYDYKEKYLAEFNMRYDGSSKFLPVNRWQFFWGASVGWRISQEEFLKNSDWLNELKIRASYGEVGNQAGINNYDGLLLYNIGSGGALVGSANLSTLTVGDELVSYTRTWERIMNYNIGLDFGFLRNRLTGSFDVFWKKNNNMFVRHAYPAVIGANAPEVNKGKFNSNGFEGMIQWSDKVGDWSYSVGGTFTFARNELVDLGGDVVKANGYRSNREGHPLSTFWGLRYAGKMQTQEQIDAYSDKYFEGNTFNMPNKEAFRLGDHMYEDVNKDGKLNADDLVDLGTDIPEIQFSFSASVGWKGIDVSAIFQGAANRTMYQGWRNGNVSYHSMLIPTRNSYNNSLAASVGNTWSPETPDAIYPSYTMNGTINNWNYQPSSWSAYDATYIRLKNITVGYSMPSKLFSRQNVISGVRFYFTGTDLWEISNIRDGWDPEAKTDPGTFERYPFLRTYTFGVNLTF